MSGASWRTLGAGDPVTLIAPGLGATEGEARIPASGLPGTRVVVTLPGHGDQPDAPPDYWHYSTIAADLVRVADETGARAAAGVSLGAASLLRSLADQPSRFSRVALLLPAALDQPRRLHGTFGAYADAVARCSAAELRALVMQGLPEDAHVGTYVDERVAALRRLGPAFTQLADDIPVPDPALLARVECPVLVIGATLDPLHPGDVAKEIAAALPTARLELFDSQAPLITDRRRVRQLLREFFA
ncbi:alpha/beta fold hydrolase [Labedaea rhizosphaerae]|uniref:Pimeloyl-ACP methyl ester carboxylesterase n=1 Tax=Labedaea rhizosphaerae TaxID=598644 RepID=A0A4R6SPQ3_LABRH|nr:alpha/beta hydrolase [Labedaea rhizosphaerae]TDQ05560.1 pimeloyl-ACP methyl ester carboxylesterase [Labedaea rhizosphaerae]